MDAGKENLANTSITKEKPSIRRSLRTPKNTKKSNDKTIKPSQKIQVGKFKLNKPASQNATPKKQRDSTALSDRQSMSSKDHPARNEQLQEYVKLLDHLIHKLKSIIVKINLKKKQRVKTKRKRRKPFSFAHAKVVWRKRTV